MLGILVFSFAIELSAAFFARRLDGAMTPPSGAHVFLILIFKRVSTHLGDFLHEQLLVVCCGGWTRTKKMGRVSSVQLGT